MLCSVKYALTSQLFLIEIKYRLTEKNRRYNFPIFQHAYAVTSTHNIGIPGFNTKRSQINGEYKNNVHRDIWCFHINRKALWVGKLKIVKFEAGVIVG